MRRMRRVKILATLGPASADRAMLAKLFEAGADVFRINMSHASHDAMRERIRMIRSLEADYGRPIGILVDLQGPKLRVGKFAAGGADLVKGASLRARCRCGARRRRPRAPAASRDPAGAAARPCGADRRRQGQAHHHRGGARPAPSPGSRCQGRISDRKGVSLPDTEIPVAAMTPKDRSDLDAALNEGVDWIAVSFVQRADDVAEVKKIAPRPGPGDGQDREAAGHRPAGRDRRDLGRPDGGARRPRGRDAARKGAGPAKAHHAHVAAARQAGRRRDPDAGIDDHVAGADPRRSLGRRDRRVRGCRLP